MSDTPTSDPKPSFRSDVTVELVKHSASDSDVLWAARVSTAGEQSLEELQKDPERSKGLINFLMRDRHAARLLRPHLDRPIVRLDQRHAAFARGCLGTRPREPDDREEHHKADDGQDRGQQAPTARP